MAAMGAQAMSAENDAIRRAEHLLNVLEAISPGTELPLELQAYKAVTRMTRAFVSVSNVKPENCDYALVRDHLNDAAASIELVVTHLKERNPQ